MIPNLPSSTHFYSIEHLDASPASPAVSISTQTSTTNPLSTSSVSQINTAPIVTSNSTDSGTSDDDYTVALKELLQRQRTELEMLHQRHQLEIEMLTNRMRKSSSNAQYNTEAKTTTKVGKLSGFDFYTGCPTVSNYRIIQITCIFSNVFKMKKFLTNLNFPDAVITAITSPASTSELPPQ